MRNIYLFIIGIMAILFSSCAPSVKTNIVKSYPPLRPDERVEVYYLDSEKLPEDAETLGSIKVGDTGFTTDYCDWESVMQLIKAHGRKTGANAVHVTEHRKPAAWGSSCHRVTATFLHVDYGDSEMAEGDDYVAEERVEGSENKMNYAFGMNPNGLKPMRPKFNLNISGGFGFRTAKIDESLNPAQREYIKQLTNGFAVDGAAEYYFNDFFGMGVVGSGYFADATGYATVNGSSYSAEAKTKDKITFFGPEFLLRTPLDDKWALGANIGMGYVGYRSNMTVGSGYYFNQSADAFGGYMSVWAEYMLTSNLGLNGNMIFQGTALDKININENGSRKVITLPEGQKEGIQTMRLSLGLRYYFGK